MKKIKDTIRNQPSYYIRWQNWKLLNQIYIYTSSFGRKEQIENKIWFEKKENIPGNDWVNGIAPFIFYHVKIWMAYPTVSYFECHILLSRCSAKTDDLTTKENENDTINLTSDMHIIYQTLYTINFKYICPYAV